MRTLKVLTSHGFSHHLLLPVLAVVGVAVIGSYVVSQGHAATPTTYSTVSVKSASTECMDNKNGKAVAYNPVQIYKCAGNNNQKWAVQGTATTAGEIISFNAGYCLNVYNAAKTAGTAVDVYPCKNSAAQLWTVNKTTGEITNPNSKLCLGHSTPISSTGTPLKLVACSTTAATDQWSVTALGTGGGATTSGPSGVASPSGSNYGNHALAQWYKALANRATAPATLVTLGDSFTEGQGSPTVAGRWTNQVLNALRSKYTVSGVTGGFGYIPAFYGTYGPDSQWSTEPALSGNASWNVARDDGNDGQSFGNGAGLGMLTVTLKSGGSESFKITGSSINIMYNYGSGSFSYRVDSGSTTTVSTSAPTGSGKSVALGSKHVTFSSAGSHTVTVSGVSGSVILEGIMTYNGDETKGIREYNGAQTGTTSGDFAAQANSMAAIIANVKADLVIIEIGGNDYNRSSGTPTQTSANVKTIVSDIRSAGSAVGHVPSIVILQTYPISGGNDALGYPYSAYANAIKSVATGDTSLGYLDLTSMGVVVGQPSPYFSTTDNSHPNSAGQAKIAGLVETYLEVE